MKNETAILASLDVETSAGKFTAHYSKNGLAQLDFPGTTRSRVETTALAPNLVRWHKLTSRAVDSVVHGRPVEENPPLDLSVGTGFQQKVWAALLRIPTGQTETYSQIAKGLRQPKAARAVGGACGSNPIPLLVPCHRVVAAGGGLGGFSGGLHWKKKLLAAESSQADSR